jgi:hypothetical protein
MRLMLSLLVALGIGSSALAQTATRPLHSQFSPSDAQQVIPKLAKTLEDDYVFPEIGRQYAATLRANLAAGRYSSFADTGAFADKVTADLQAIHRDGHLVLVAPRTDRPAGAPPSSAPPDAPPPIGKSGWIAPGVAYIEFRSFPGDEVTLAKLRQFVADHAKARVLIIDTSNEFGGGWLSEANVLFSELFSRPRDLVAIDIRQAVEERIGGFPVAPTLHKVQAPEGVVRYIHSVDPSAEPKWRTTKVYVLISHSTVSAGEHLAFALKQSHRATLIGERTWGKGNVETDMPMPAGYVAVVPFARAFDPRTGKGWEGVGVQPDIHTHPGRALAAALKLAGVKESAKAALASPK